MHKVWLFQANPRVYNLSEEVPLLLDKTDDWGLNRNREEVKSGATAILWQAGSKAGIYAIGTIVGQPYKKAGKVCIDIRYDRLLEKPVFKDEITKRPSLSKLEVLTRPYDRNPFHVTDSEWQTLKKLLSKNARAGVAGVSEQLDVIREEKYESGGFDTNNPKDARERQLASIVVRQGQPRFREQLLKVYGGRCAITDCDVTQALEAANIVAYFGPKSNFPTNGLLLRADIHTLFDLSLMAVDPTNLLVVVSKTLLASSYRSLAGKPIRLPEGNSAHPSVPALKLAYKKFQLEESKR